MIFRITLFLALCFSAVNANAQGSSEMRLFSKWISGEFTTENETVQPPRTAHERMRFVRIWKEAPDLWLFMEQSQIDKPEEPFRQWVFWVEEQGEIMMMELNLLTGEVDIPGNLSGAEIEKHLKIDDLEVERGCELFIDYDGFAVFSGATVQNYCELDIKGASYITIRMNLNDEKIDWWEYGMKPGGEFVWGSATNQQVFNKKK